MPAQPLLHVSSKMWHMQQLQAPEGSRAAAGQRQRACLDNLWEEGAVAGVVH